MVVGLSHDDTQIEDDWGLGTPQSTVHSPLLHPPLHVSGAQTKHTAATNTTGSSTHARRGNGNRNRNRSSCQERWGNAGKISKMRRTAWHWDQKQQAKRADVVDVAQSMMDARLQLARAGSPVPSLPDRINNNEWVTVASVLRTQRWHSQPALLVSQSREAERIVNRWKSFSLQAPTRAWCSWAGLGWAGCKSPAAHRGSSSQQGASAGRSYDHQCVQVAGLGLFSPARAGSCCPGCSVEISPPRDIQPCFSLLIALPITTRFTLPFMAVHIAVVVSPFTCCLPTQASSIRAHSRCQPLSSSPARPREQQGLAELLTA